MPVISVTMAEKQISVEQKHEMIRSFTAEAVRITELPEHAFTILINELKDDNIGVGGKILSEMKSSLQK